jgi:hypothetical protein
MGLPTLGCAGLGLAAAVAASAPTWPPGRVSAKTIPAVEAGQAAELSLTILEPVLPAAAIEVWLESDDVELPENRLGNDDVVDPLARQPRVRGRFVAPALPGEYVVVGHVLYVTCGPKWCRPKRADVKWTVRVLASELEQGEEKGAPPSRPQR